MAVSKSGWGLNAIAKPAACCKLAARPAPDASAYPVCMSNASRSLYLICYDVCNPRRLYRVRKYLLAYKVGGQKSFFECWLTPAELREVRATLNELLDLSEDRAHIFQLDPRMKCDLLGQATPPVTDVFMIL